MGNQELQRHNKLKYIYIQKQGEIKSRTANLFQFLLRTLIRESPVQMGSSVHL